MSDQLVVFENLDHIWDITPYVINFRFYEEPRPRTNLFFHKDVEFVYIYEGNILFNIDGEEVNACAGNLVCANSYAAHCQQLLSRARYVRLYISFNFLKNNGFDSSAFKIQKLIQDPKIDEFFSKITTEAKNNESWHDLNMVAHIFELFAYLARNYSFEAPTTNKSKIDNETSTTYEHIIAAVDYITQNFKEKNISLDELSKVSGFSKFYFLKMFKQVIGYTPTNYINKIRCDYAKQLILRGSTITDAAFISGYNNLSNFEKQFKLHKGYPPSDLINNKANK